MHKLRALLPGLQCLPKFSNHRKSRSAAPFKIETVKTMLKDSNASNLWHLQAGNNDCTMCHKCTDICPSNIDLQSLWSVLDKKLTTMGYDDNYKFIKDTSLEEWTNKEKWTNKEDISIELNPKNELTSNLADRVDAFESCIQCTICSNVCPIVDYDSSQNDVTPHQVMNLLRLNKKYLATGTRMVWTCLTCYTCQEYCPQQIRVADILLELKNSGSVSADMMKQTTHKAYK
jgi:heterodisulfide reductase subunit C